MNEYQRLHSFDNLRALMMWLGIVLHVAINHTTGPSALPFRDSKTTPLADLLLVFIHAFRMPVFFILAGYFVALLVARRGYPGMLKHRLRRLALPFAIFWPILIVCTTLLMLVYLHLMAYGSVGLDVSLIAKKSKHTSPFNTMQMWFIWYLILFCVLTAVLAPLASRLPAALRHAGARVLHALASSWWGPLVLAIPLAFIGSFYRAGMLAPNGSFIPNPAELVHSGLFFVIGLVLHRHQDSLFPLLTARAWRNMLAGLVSFFVALGLFKSFVTNPHGLAHIEASIAFVYNLTSWLWSLGLIGLSLRFLTTQNRVLRYVSESSYWVFLVHMLGTIGFGAILYSQPFGPVTKIVLNIGMTTAACLLTYQVLVRYTLIGVLLNVRRQVKAVSAAVPVVAEPK